LDAACIPGTSLAVTITRRPIELQALIDETVDYCGGMLEQPKNGLSHAESSWALHFAVHCNTVDPRIVQA